MTTSIPTAALSEHLEQRIAGRRVLAAVFATFQLDPGFFEQQIVPVLLDIPVSHAKHIRTAQLDDALRHGQADIAVYYDANGIVLSDEGGPKLDVKRIPVRRQNGVFHPKNIFLLMEDAEADEDGQRAKALVIGTTSANITRSGWWENVEACHFEELAEGAPTRLRESVTKFLRSINAHARGGADHTALERIREFLRSSTAPRVQRTTSGSVHPHFWPGDEPLVEFLRKTAGEQLRRARLEVLSPFFDDAPTCAPLEALIEEFEPTETRVFLPTNPAGEALCPPGLFEQVHGLTHTYWGYLPSGLTQLSNANATSKRFMHAKVYRFFKQSPKREYYLITSANLTTAAHQTRNIESGVLVEVRPEQPPDFWLKPVAKKVPAFAPQTTAEEAASTGGTRLSVCFHWDTGVAEVFWDGPTASPELRLEGRGVTLATLEAVPSRTWHALTPESAAAIRDMLQETAVLTVHDGTDPPGQLLIQEQGWTHKPHRLLQLSVADILRYWALLTPAQRSAFIEARAPELASSTEGAELIARTKPLVTTDTVFDRFAGIFHAFGCLEREVRASLESDNRKDATYRLFGKKHDSLGSLLDKVLTGEPADPVDRYVIVSCAKQLCLQVGREFPEFWRERRADVEALARQLECANSIRNDLVSSGPDDMPTFLDWFDERFRARAVGQESTAST